MKYLTILIFAGFFNIAYASEQSCFEIPSDPDEWCKASFRAISDVLIVKDGSANHALIKLLELSFPNGKPINITNPEQRTANVNTAITKLKTLDSDEKQTKYLDELYKMHYEVFLSTALTR